MSILITVDQKGARVDTIEKIIEEHIRSKYPQATISVVRKNTPETRQARYDEVMGMLSDAHNELEALRDELQEWYDSIPENLQSGGKADEIQEAIDTLENQISSLEDAEGEEVTFPSMY